MATMADVARRAGVSAATVSHVLNGTRPVRPATRQAVLDAIEALGYTHNTLARSLVTARTGTVGLAVSAARHPYFAEILSGVEAAALEHGYGLLVADPHDDPGHELRVVRLLHQRRVDGLILTPSAAPAALLDYLRRHRVPTVLLDRVPAPEDGGGGWAFDQVGAENAGPAEELVAHLAGLGHTRIGLIAGLAGLSTSRERLAGYRAGLAAAGLRFDPALVAAGHSTADGAEAAARALLDRPAPPTSLLAANDAMTLGTLRALRALRRRVPRDVALVGFGDFPWADLFEPRLTAVAQPAAEIGATALRLLLDRVDAPDRPPRTVRLPCAFVHRSSCGCPDDAAAPKRTDRLPRIPTSRRGTDR
ncbi:LacI family DNA-binding transcriptional regulator [Streptomyces sp. NPDC058045]|uniref:LacI family DNA-binding transcriptional regulator n=1 Tax=Streptomyces sp. NPDC058045 TaxID=3346311 RepID=UPI0036EBE24D